MTNSNENFNSLIKDKTILQAITNMGIKVPTEIQIKAIPIILAGKNIIAESATGTGKTIAFLAGILHDVEKKKKVQALIIVPTRELALQVFEEVKKISKIKNVSSCAVYGGESIHQQARDLKFADIVIGTPGRLIDQMSRGNLRLESCKYLILDEADRMCDMGFYEDISKIIDKTPKNRQTLLFSATITKDISNIVKKYIPSAERVSVESKVDPSNLLQEYYIVKQNQKFSLIIHLIKEHVSKSIVFSNTRREVDVIYNNLVKNGVEAFKLHGGLEQRKRTHTIGKYHAHKDAVLISSDISARGIHVDNLEYIYNYDIPKDDTQYVHRIGRTARAGKKGKAITILTQKEELTFLKMCKHFGFSVVKKELPNISSVFLDRGNKTKSSNKPRSNDFFMKQMDGLNKSPRSPRSSQEFNKHPRDRSYRERARNFSEFPKGPFSRPSKPAREMDKDNKAPFRGKKSDGSIHSKPLDKNSDTFKNERERRALQKKKETSIKHKSKLKQKKYVKKR